MATRRDELIKALNDKGVDFRNDSKLCANYINDVNFKMSLEQVVQRMCEVKYLFDYCNMAKHYGNVKDEWRTTDSDDMDVYMPSGGYNEVASDFYACDLEKRDKTVFDDMFDEAEERALAKFGGKYPKVFPWLRKPTDSKQRLYDELQKRNKKR
jgi:hypothetical protein